MSRFRSYGNRRYITRIFLLVLFWFLTLMSFFQFQKHMEIFSPLTEDIQFRLEPLPRLDLVTETVGLQSDIDRSQKMSESELFQEVQKRMPNLPGVYWSLDKKKPTGINKNCAKYPDMYELEFNNLYWQTLTSSNGTFQIFGAYFDDRPENKLKRAIRILGMINRVDPKVTTHCQIWFEDKDEPVIAKVVEYKLIWYRSWGNNRQGVYQPYLMTCPLPQDNKTTIPASVSLVEKPCDFARNNLKVIYDKPAAKKDFAVCVKGLDFLHEDLSVKLVEWIELLGLLGAEKVYFYELQVHPNVSKVLKHFEEKGQVHVTPVSLAGGQPNTPIFQHLYLKKKIVHKRQSELIPYNDCFYKHMYQYRYIALLDIDEVIMPVSAANWSELMEKFVLPKSIKIREEPRASYNVRNVYFFDDSAHSHGWIKGIPKYMHMLQHIYRAKNFTKPNYFVKCFHNTDKVLTLHNHFPLSCLGYMCTSYPIETEDAQLQHYRADCVTSLKKSCEDFKANSLMDTTIWKYKNELISKVTNTLKTLGFFSESGVR